MSTCEVDIEALGSLTEWLATKRRKLIIFESKMARCSVLLCLLSYLRSRDHYYAIIMQLNCYDRDVFWSSQSEQMQWNRWQWYCRLTDTTCKRMYCEPHIRLPGNCIVHWKGWLVGLDFLLRLIDSSKRISFCFFPIDLQWWTGNMSSVIVYKCTKPPTCKEILEHKVESLPGDPW